MGSLSDYAENELLDHALGTAYTAVSTVYLALHTADPTDAGSGAEIGYTGYARTAITFGAAASRRVTQSGVVTFPASTGGSGTASHWAVWDASSSGNMLAHGALGASKSIVSGNTPSVASGEVYVEISTGHVSDYLANNWLDLMFRNQTFTAPSNYVGLTTATVSDSNTGTSITEVSGGAYARVQVNESGGASPAWGTASSGATDNQQAISFATATASWGTVTSTVICDASTNGNLLFYDNDTVDQAVGTDDDVSFAIGALDVSLT